MSKQTLAQFYNNIENLDGHYVVWKSGINYTEDFNTLYGFSGSIVEYSNNGGFKNYPVWMDETEEEAINIMLIEEIPNLRDL